MSEHDTQNDMSPLADKELDLSGYSPRTRESIMRRLEEDPEDGPESAVFEHAVTRTAEESQDAPEGD